MKIRTSHSCYFEHEGEHGVYCQCGVCLFFDEKDLTPPKTTVVCPKCGHTIIYYTRGRLDFEKPQNRSARIKDVIYNNPATIVKWTDGTKTVVKCQSGDTYNPETGLAMCIIKKLYGNKGNYNDIFKKWLPKRGQRIAICPNVCNI